MSSFLARARRACVNGLMRAHRIPVARPFAQIGMRVLFDSLADDWERIRRDPTYREGFDAALQHLPPELQPQRALDVACGTGFASRILLEHWPDLALTGCDISPRMVRQARELVPDATFDVGSVHDLPYADDEFDLVTILDGLLDPDELLRVLHPTGYLLIVYSKGGTTPVSRPLDEVSTLLEARGAVCHQHTSGPAHVLVARCSA